MIDTNKLDPEVVEYIEALEQDNKTLTIAMSEMRGAMEQLTDKVRLLTTTLALAKAREENYSNIG